MREVYVNLARRPFVNSRPVVRVAATLWLLGLLLAASNVWLYRNYYLGAGAKAKRLAEIDTALAAEARLASQAQARLSGLDLHHQNAVAAFLNQKIEDRSFSWSRLVDRLATLLPNDARLLSLAPERGDQEKRVKGELVAVSGEPRPVRLGLTAEAQSDEAVNALVDALFADPAFRNPNPSREARDGEGDIRVELTVDFLPQQAVENPVTTSPATGSEMAAAPEETR